MRLPDWRHARQGASRSPGSASVQIVAMTGTVTRLLFPGDSQVLPGEPASQPNARENLHRTATSLDVGSAGPGRTRRGLSYGHRPAIEPERASTSVAGPLAVVGRDPLSATGWSGPA